MVTHGPEVSDPRDRSAVRQRNALRRSGVFRLLAAQRRGFRTRFRGVRGRAGADFQVRSTDAGVPGDVLDRADQRAGGADADSHRGTADGRADIHSHSRFDSVPFLDEPAVHGRGGFPGGDAVARHHPAGFVRDRLGSTVPIAVPFHVGFVGAAADGAVSDSGLARE